MPAGSGLFRIRRIRNRGFGVRDGMPDRAGHDDEGLPYNGIGNLVYGMGILIMVVYNRAILWRGCWDEAGMSQG